MALWPTHEDIDELAQIGLEREELAHEGLLANGEIIPFLASPGHRRNNISALTPEKARLIDELHNNGPVSPSQRMAQVIISDRRSACVDFVADPLLDYIRHLPQDERAKVDIYLRAR
eukprot:4602238-Pyramimonas_sp.AAC.1